MFLAGSISIGLIVIIGGFVILRRKQNNLERDYQQIIANKNIILTDKNVLFIAQESDGLSHFRGMGYLILSDDELYFKRQLGGKTIAIPIQSILRVEKVERLAGQSPGKLMLGIFFKTDSGQEDSIAFMVKKLDQWQKVIKIAIEDAHS